MSGLEQVKRAIAGALEKAGIAARLAFEPGWAKGYSGPVVAVGLRRGESRGGLSGRRFRAPRYSRAQAARRMNFSE